MNVQAILALDQGTTSSRAIVFGHEGTVLAAAQHSFAQHFPQPGWVEHDPEDIWDTQMRAARDALAAAGLTPADLAAVGIANQRETCVLWNSESGETLGNALVWQCRRTAQRCEELHHAGWEPRIRDITGLRLDPYFSATKLEWLLQNQAEAAGLAARGLLRAGTIDSFLIWRLTGGRTHVTDYSNASRTMLFDLRALDWDDELLSLFGIPRAILPTPRPSSCLLGTTAPHVFGSAVPIAGTAGDQQAALFGHGCLAAGQAKNTYGTGCFLLMNTGGEPVWSKTGLLTTIAWGREERNPGAKGATTGRGEATGHAGGTVDVAYALEGSVFVAGAAVQWLRDGLGLIDSSEHISRLAAQVPDNGGVYFVPALTGLGAPFWDPYARGLIIGLTRGTTKAHLARAVEEAICCQTKAVLDGMADDTGAALSALRVDGGAAVDDLLLQLQADLLELPVVRPRIREVTALGAAALAGLAVGVWSEDEVARLAGTERLFMPRTSQRTIYAEWLRAAERARDWARPHPSAPGSA